VHGVILVTGASGRIGRRVTELLARDGRRLRLMSRSPQKVSKAANAETVRGDFAEPSTLESAFAGITTALIISGSGEPGERALRHRNAFAAAAHAGVEHIVYLSLQGTAADSKYPYSRDHYLSEQYLAAEGLSFTVLRNSFYTDMFLEKFDARGVIRGPAGRGRGAFVSREDVARTSAAVLRKPPGGIYEVTGPEAMSVAEVAARLSALVSRALRYEEESANAARERLREGEPSTRRIELSVGWFEAIAAGELQNVSNAVLRFTGAAPLTLEEYFQAFPDLSGSFQQHGPTGSPAPGGRPSPADSWPGR
jgi:NAD(P)H dehydrogenase (quinone)